MLIERKIDLHTHSTASDGSDSPTKLLENAVSVGLSAVALCDHDTISGLEEFEQAAKEMPIEAIPGIEISTSLFSKEVHIVGLFVDRTSEHLNAPLALLRQNFILKTLILLKELLRVDYLNHLVIFIN